MFAKRLFTIIRGFKKTNYYHCLNIGLRQQRYCFTSSSDPTQVALLEQVEAKVYQVLKTAAKCNQSKLSRSATFQELGFDSLDSVQLVVAMEQFFGFDIPNEQAQKIGTVEAAINTFYRHLNAKIANKIVQTPETVNIKVDQK